MRKQRSWQQNLEKYNLIFIVRDQDKDSKEETKSIRKNNVAAYMGVVITLFLFFYLEKQHH
jgi:hypothetical protein